MNFNFQSEWKGKWFFIFAKSKNEASFEKSQNVNSPTFLLLQICLRKSCENAGFPIISEIVNESYMSDQKLNNR
jgi:hypothetical protein